MAAMRPVIAIDVDDVIFPFVPELANYYNAEKGTNLTQDDFFSYDFSKVWGGTVQETGEIVEAFLNRPYLHISPVDGARDAFSQLSQDFDIVILTARNTLFEPSTTEWLRAHFSELFKHAIFAGSPHDGRGFRPKGEVCLEYGVSLMIDDHPSNILSAVEHGADGVLFGERSWSVLDNMPDNVAYCKDWPTTVEYIYDKWRR